MYQDKKKKLLHFKIEIAASGILCKVQQNYNQIKSNFMQIP